MRKPVLTIFYQFDPWHTSIGGIQTVVRNFIKFALPDFRVRLVGLEGTATGPIGVWQRREWAGRAIDFFPLLRQADDDRRHPIPTTLRYTLGLLGRSFASDFMHFHRLEPTLLTRGWHGRKMLFVHNDIHQQIQAGANQGIAWQQMPGPYLALERQVMPQFDRVLSCNSESTALYRRQYPAMADRILPINNGFDPDQFYPLAAPERHRQREALAKQMGLPPETRFLLFAGRLHPQKDPLLLLQAFAQVRYPDAHLLIAGEGELMGAMFTERERLGLQRRVTFLGAVPQGYLADLHRVAHGVVLTSAYEGFPLVVLEALACGTPVATTEVGETPRFLRPDCGLVRRDSPTEIAAAWDLLLHHPDRFPSAACVSNARPYSAKTIVEAVYHDMLQRWHHDTVLARPQVLIPSEAA